MGRLSVLLVYMLTREEITSIVYRENHKVGRYRYICDNVVELVERLRAGESIARMDAAKVDDDDLALALEIRASGRFR